MRESIPQGTGTTGYGRAVRRTRRVFSVCALAVLVAFLGIGCSDEDPATGPACPAGTTERTSSNELAGEGQPTREDAIRAELQNLGLEASDEAITAGVVAAGPGENAGTEVVTIEMRDGTSATMTLAPLDPNWAVESSTWCAPDS
jgi:hypothetical protein